jgi:hypothetical protein
MVFFDGCSDYATATATHESQYDKIETDKYCSDSSHRDSTIPGTATNTIVLRTEAHRTHDHDNECTYTDEHGEA